jgi:hypothetical protein
VKVSPDVFAVLVTGVLICGVLVGVVAARRLGPSFRLSKEYARSRRLLRALARSWMKTGGPSSLVIHQCLEAEAPDEHELFHAAVAELVEDGVEYAGNEP